MGGRDSNVVTSPVAKLLPLNSGRGDARGCLAGPRFGQATHSARSRLRGIPRKAVLEVDGEEARDAEYDHRDFPGRVAPRV